ncbi:MAG: peptide chain release factor N(5)-glutamine methyltransferase, partial [Verrucomicrobiota bacterium]
MMALPPTLLEILQRSAEFLGKAGVENPRLEAEWLLAHVLGCKRLQLYLDFERPMLPEVLDQLRPMVRRRAQREPLQYILGTTEFAGLELTVDRRALIPRPETEALVDELRGEYGTTPPPSVLDLGTGSGAIALALAAAWPGSSVTAVDRSPGALALARENAARTGLDARVEWLGGSWFGPLAGRVFDLIVSNPPYLAEAEWKSAAPEVRGHEPHEALVAPGEGLADLESLLREAPRYLTPGGCLALETGITQHEPLRAEAESVGYARCESRLD